MKLVNYRCLKCKKQKETLLTTEELKFIRNKTVEHLVQCDCGEEMEEFNFKNNSQVWQFNDNR